jgi:SAM-dependent methyltransferase
LTHGLISERVKAQYEAFPYPNHGLFIPLRAQEAYASHSLFAARILEQTGPVPAIRRNSGAEVLLAGCGDVFPYMASFWEPRSHRLNAVDLSARSLRRARVRCLARLRGMTWMRGNLEDADFALPGGLSHIDSYGVLHHMAEPARVLERFERHLLPGGTARIMVYNAEARTWIRHLQRAFALLGLSPFLPRDMERGRALLDALAGISPALRERFAPMRGGAFANASRFVDTFLHAREARLDLGFWLRAIENAGLRVIGVFDRYAELDDLPNPLLEVPSLKAWQERIEDRRFENNFELYLAKAGPTGPAPGKSATRRLPAPHFMKSPPMAWFEYPETRSIPWMARRRLWSRFLRGICGRDAGFADAWAGRLAPGALQRLARIGALFPDDFRGGELRDLLRRPLHDFMEPPVFQAPGPVRGHREIRARVEGILREKNRPGKCLEAVMNRLESAQKP